MELKEIVNLRKLGEFYDDTLPEELCEVCPLRGVCGSASNKPVVSECLIERMLGISEDHRDLYDLERDGELIQKAKI